MPLTEAEVKQVAHASADEVMSRIAERQLAELMLHSIPYLEGSPGIVVDEAKARATPCRGVEYKPGKWLKFSPGIVGALSDVQEEVYCPETIAFESPGLQRRLTSWQETVDGCKKEIALIPKEESERRLVTWMQCMSRGLEKRGIKA